MDLNYLLFRHQLSVAAATTAACPSARHAHRGLANGYAARIRSYQTLVGADARLACLK